MNKRQIIGKKAMGTKELNMIIAAINIILIIAAAIVAMNLNKEKKETETVSTLQADISFETEGRDIEPVYEGITKEYILTGKNVTITEITTNKDIYNQGEPINYCVRFEDQNLYYNNGRFACNIKIQLVLLDEQLEVKLDRLESSSVMVSEKIDEWSYCSTISTSDLKEGKYHLNIAVQDKMLTENIALNQKDIWVSS